MLDYTYNPVEVSLDIPQENLTFKGYRRKNGDVGIRNEIWIIPTVGCVNGIVNQLAEALRRETKEEGIDAIMAFLIITDALSWETTMKTRRKSCATWYSIPMPELYWS